MKLTLESTDQIVRVDGRPARVWLGEYKGAPVVAFICSIAVAEPVLTDDFARQLRETSTPALDADARAVLVKVAGAVARTCAPHGSTP